MNFSTLTKTKNERYRKTTWLLPWTRFTTLLFIISLCIMCCMAWLLLTKRNEFDQEVFSAIRSPITPATIKFMRFISFFSNHFFLIPVNLLLLLYFLFLKNKWASYTVFVVAMGSVIILSVLKRLFHRERPTDRFVEGITNFSFPSGHAFMSVTFYGLIIWWIAITVTDKKLQRWAIFLLLLFILLIGFSRVYLKVHYPSDVIAGWSLGTCWLLLSLQFMNKLRENHQLAP